MEGVRGRDELGSAWASIGTRPDSLGGEQGVRAPRCRSLTSRTPSRWDWRILDTASGMFSLRPANSHSSGPSGADRSTAGSGAGRLGGSRAGERRGCGPRPRGGRGVPRVRVWLEGGCCMVVVAAGMRAGLHPFIAVRSATPWQRASTAMSRAAAAGWDLSERRGLYLRWYLGSGSPSDSEVAVRSTCSSGSCRRRCFCPRPPRWALRAG